ncbi:(p)ppGpp synthetase [Piscirickettsia salmonis]|uniref:GTP pyrophosphokinase n=1 Tax=Piscirickettsia salmonis TaxID=1238 RepID=A0A9Q6LTI0_PISSA|nr:GTP diphosphokinase [Piscirickettsia salmonis]ALA24457.1 (p)ppGpp synthetase [Piscirickettsia salmonis]APS44818.1 (p)ppGpp synthetase [Piscirickettsia salmonis]APS48177.1 (p)ppGpp synthetase [Piscirickettsia salmonis]APS49448.1 (p)ppGpp synthetase [Piscirickettsia salmonis]APS52624.1 (p)ppGpp synthetase [Piscirickettsia salmonis]
MVQVRENVRPSLDEDVTRIESWLSSVHETLGYQDEQMTLIAKACELAQQYGRETAALCGHSAYYQGVMMADILIELHVDHETFAAAIIYPLYYYGAVSCEVIETELSSAALVRIVTGVKRMEAMQTIRRGQDMASMDRLRKMLLSMVEDVRIVLVKLAERAFALRVIKEEAEPVRKQIALDVQEIYAPLANRLGVGQLKWEMEDLAFRYLEKETYKRIAKLLDERRLDRERYIRDVINELESALANAHIEGEVSGRVKHIYSIWRKMHKKSLAYDEIYDVRALRIMVGEVKDCYAALGIVHSLWKHIPREFDDYIATPKENGYRSIHTAVVGPEGKTVEVQIRTFNMHEEAELGVAAHWRYKEGVKHDASYESKINWLRQLLDWQEEVADANDAIEDLKAQVVDDRVYIFTPKGDVMDLPRGATPLDFAYHVHTEVGHRCKGAKVGGVIVPLTYELKTGDRVEVLTAKNGQPSRDWLSSHLGYLKTTRARNKAASWFKQLRREDNIIEGRALLEREAERLGIENIDYGRLTERYKMHSVDDIFIGVACGELRPLQLLNYLQPSIDKKEELMPVAHAVSLLQKEAQLGEVVVAGVDNLMTHMARCCKPVPGDQVVGYITMGRGISVHRQNCSNVAFEHVEKSRLVEVQWGDVECQSYPVDICIWSTELDHTTKALMMLLSGEKISVQSLNVQREKKGQPAVVLVTLKVESLTILGRLLDKIQQLTSVMEVTRKR